MGTPATRTPVRVARGTYSNLNTNKADILEGEICYATDQNKIYIKEGSNLETHESADASKLPLAGGTMTGAIAMGTNKITGAGDPTGAQDVATKTYVDTADALKLPLGGGTMTGTLTLSGNPSGTNDAANKSYVDTQALAGGQFTGNINVAANNIKFDSDSGNTNNITIAGPTSITSSAAYKLPSADGSSAQVLKTDGSGNLSWASVGDATKAGDNTWTGSQRGSVSTLTYGATVAIDMDTTNNHKVTLTGNIRFNNPTNCDADAIGQSGSIFIIQDGTGGHEASWGTDGGTSSFHWKGGTAPTLSSGANAVDRIDYIVYAADKIHCVATIGISANT